MVKITKSPLPIGALIKTESDYRSGDIFEILANDCHNKCYICEDKPASINVEHLVSHRNEPTLKYGWDNLFISCAHCNNIKGTRYDGIINPSTCDPEDFIGLSVKISDDFIESVCIDTFNQGSSTLETAILLGYVYNGGSTDIKDIECANLRNEHLLPDIQRFNQYIRGHIDEPELGYDAVIKKEISRTSKFAAFKRKIVRDDPRLSAIFADALI